MLSLTCSRESKYIGLILYITMTQSNTESLASSFDFLTTEYQICRRKLESKCEALLILSRELDQCRSERDQFKLMAEQLRDRYQMVKRQLTGDVPMSASIEIDPKTYSDIQTQTLARMLFDTKEANKSLKFEVDDLRQKLQDAEGDIKLLREQIARSRVGTTDEGLTTRHFPAHEREELVRQLEASREEYMQLERDLQQVLDEKEELVTERAAYRTKYERLNTELNYILGGDEKRIVDLDVLIMENKFLQERLKQMEEEKTMAIATVTKYKSILEKKKTKGILKLGQCRSDGLVITQKQVQQVMQSKSSITASPQAVADLQGLCAALLETINDKNLALSHQRKTNKLLGNRVNELEKKLKTLEVSGLWSVTGHFSNLEKLKAECEEIKTLVPHQFSQSTDSSSGAANNVSDFESSASNSAVNSPSHQRLNQLTKLDLEELDLLPTKEETPKVSNDIESLITTEATTGGTEPGIDLADVMSKNSEALRIALAEAMLRSLIRQDSEDSFIAENWSNSAVDPDDKMIEYLDCEQREAAIQECLKKDSDDDLEGFYDYDAGDDGEEAGEEFEHLLESVTSKLLERSQELQRGKSLDQKVKTKHHNVYITDDFRTIDDSSVAVLTEAGLVLSLDCDKVSLNQHVENNKGASSLMINLEESLLEIPDSKDSQTFLVLSEENLNSSEFSVDNKRCQLNDMISSAQLDGLSQENGCINDVSIVQQGCQHSQVMTSILPTTSLFSQDNCLQDRSSPSEENSESVQLCNTLDSDQHSCEENVQLT